ncbi:GTP cyclohydrolase II [Sphingopyxis sp. SE2]|uniref:GTP cyclohydrolase II n=1 Tax=Sphingopyxis sp. SE2 TaxID=1586240 RepID=UPI0028C151A5|nr:GTP cyclohydrolase II [Sphingopyxis sp. SE2]MDT7531451.1 GTP cyclohydrolase II [Sphingopyxis sp. SE2]
MIVEGYFRVAQTTLPLDIDGTPRSLSAYAYRRDQPGDELIALVHRAPDCQGTSPLVRLHSACATGDALGSLRCDCGHQLNAALSIIAASDYGILIYLSTQEGRGIGLSNKIRAYALQDGGLDTVDANVELGLAVDARDYAGAAAVLHDLGAPRVRLLTNNPEKVRALHRFGITVEERIRLSGGETPYNQHYLATKRSRMNHWLR